MEQTGMRWTVEGAQAMLYVRALYLNEMGRLPVIPSRPGTIQAIWENGGVAGRELRPIDNTLESNAERHGSCRTVITV